MKTLNSLLSYGGISISRVGLLVALIGFAMVLYLTYYVVMNQLDPAYLGGIGTIALGLGSLVVNMIAKNISETGANTIVAEVEAKKSQTYKEN